LIAYVYLAPKLTEQFSRATIDSFLRLLGAICCVEVKDVVVLDRTGRLLACQNIPDGLKKAPADHPSIRQAEHCDSIDDLPRCRIELDQAQKFSFGIDIKLLKEIASKAASPTLRSRASMALRSIILSTTPLSSSPTSRAAPADLSGMSGDLLSGNIGRGVTSLA
jgi:hypothetical protein